MGMEYIYRKLVEGRLPIFLRAAALKHIGSTLALSEIALATQDASIYEAAIGKISDIEVLESIAQEAKYFRVGELAVEALDEPTVLERIASRGSNQRVCFSAFDKLAKQQLSDRKIFERLALNAEWHIVRNAAIKYVADQEVLKAIASKAQPGSSRSVIEECLSAIRNIGEVSFNKEIAKDPFIDAGARKAAIERIQNQEILAGLAFSSNSIVSAAAIDKIVDQEILYTLANSRMPEVRTEATAKLDYAHLQKFAEHMKAQLSDEQVRDDLIRQLQRLPARAEDFETQFSSAIKYRNRGFRAVAHFSNGWTEETDTGVPNPDFNVREANDGYEGSWCGNAPTIIHVVEHAGGIEIEPGTPI